MMAGTDGRFSALLAAMLGPPNSRLVTTWSQQIVATLPPN